MENRDFTHLPSALFPDQDQTNRCNERFNIYLTN